jgi:hypothetical protein
MNLMLYVFLCFCLSMCMLVMLVSIYYSWMMHEKNEKTPICAKIGIVMHLLIFKIQCTNSGGVFYFDELSSFYFKSETLFLLS